MEVGWQPKGSIARREPQAIRAATNLIGPRVVHRLLGTAKTGIKRRWSDIIDLLPGTPSVLSVDVFDTVLTRRISTDDALVRSAAHIAQTNQAWPGSVGEYVEHRRSRAAMGPAQSIQHWFDGVERSDELIASEVQLESDLQCVIPGAAEALARARSLGWKIVFVSDMHHSGAQIKQWLERFDLVQAEDDVISSSDLGISKSQGDLFDHMTASYSDVVHVGNQLWADVVMAADRGVLPLAMRSAESNRYERVFENESGGFGPVVAAAARRARLDVPDDGTVESEMQRMGASVVGPIMVGFFSWVRNHARDLDIPSVAYLARDGRLPYEVAQSMPKDHRGELMLSYLEGSRRTWQIPAASAMGVSRWIQLGTRDGVSFLNHSRDTIPFESLLGRFGLNTEDQLPVDLSALPACNPLDECSLEIWDEYVRSDAAHRLIAKRSDEAREILYRFLKAIDLPVRRTAFVDIGWRGQMAYQMNAVLEGYLDEEPTHLHFGAYRTIDEIEKAVSIHRFAIHDSDQTQPVDRPVSCLESLTASGGPKLIDLVWTPDGADPVYSEAQPEIFGSAKQNLWAGALATASKMPEASELAAWGIEASNLEAEVRELLRLFWMHPTPSEAAAFATLKFETDDDGRSIQPVAQPYSVSEVFRMRTGVARQWQRGSIELASAPLRVALKAAAARRNKRSS